MPLTIINAAGVRRLLPMNECIDVMESTRNDCRHVRSVHRG